MPWLDFTQVDVFTRRRMEGNALAVFRSGRGLTAAQMQAIAREMNLFETTFLFPGDDAADVRVPIFTPRQELPFAGHPTLGTAFVVARSVPRPLIRLRMKAGVIPVRVQRRRQFPYLEMRQKDPVFGRRVKDLRALAAAFGLRVADLDGRYPPQTVSTGLPFLIVPLRSADALARVDPRQELVDPLLTRAGAFAPYFLVTGEKHFQARMFDRGQEDPATGSAAGCAAAFLVACGACPPDATLVISQGRFVRRPSRISAAASLAGGRVHNVRVGGHVVEVLRGRLRL